MHKNLLLFVLTLFGEICYSQVGQSKLIMDSVEVVNFYNFLHGSQTEIIGYDQYFIYNNQLYNNAVESSNYLCKLKYSDDINVISRYISKESFYERISNGKCFHKYKFQDFLKLHQEIFLNDSANRFREFSESIFVYTKKIPIIFYTFTCNDIDKNLLAGTSTHDKIFENFFYYAWRGNFLLPLKVVNIKKQY